MCKQGILNVFFHIIEKKRNVYTQIWRAKRRGREKERRRLTDRQRQTGTDRVCERERD